MPDRFAVRAVVCFLGVFALGGLGGLVFLINGATSTIDATLLAIVAGPTGTALGALGMLLTNISNGGGPQEVIVANDRGNPAEAIPVTETAPSAKPSEDERLALEAQLLEQTDNRPSEADPAV